LQTPYVQQCKIYLTKGFGSTTTVGEGSGTLIGRRHVLTASHVIYDHKEGFPKGALIAPCLYQENGQDIAPYGYFEARTFIVRSEFVDNKDYDYDIGMIVLDPDETGVHAGSYAGWMGYAVRDLNNKTGNTSGYPGDLFNGRRQYYTSGRMRNKIFDLWQGQFSYPSEKRVVYDWDTMGGQSGAGIWIKEGTQRYVVGVHSGGDSYPYWNTGVTITNQIYDWINEQKRLHR
jgi:V8-like Glu-specific endopeptidase